MSRIEIPEILNKLAAAEDGGMLLGRVSSVQRQIALCREWGFDLRVEGDRVYLPPDPDLMIPAWIERETPSLIWDRLEVKGFLEVGSTNDEALTLARCGTSSGTLVYAERQTAGRGRKGRPWASPACAGLYFSLVLRPHQPQSCWLLLTHVASVALARALSEISCSGQASRPLEVDIKWPNDVLVAGKKVAGILIETDTRSNGAVVVGVGINVKSGSVPEGLRDSATSVSDQAGSPIPRRWLLVRFLSSFQVIYRLFERGEFGEILELWKRCSSMWNGTPVWIGEGTARRQGVTCGLSEFGALRVRLPDGAEQVLLSEEVTVRRI